MDIKTIENLVQKAYDERVPMLALYHSSGISRGILRRVAQKLGLSFSQVGVRRSLNKTRYLGRRYGKLVVESFAGEQEPIRKSYRQTLWLCKCDCGQKKIVSSCQLDPSPHRGIKSCGCYSPKSRGMNHPSWKGYKELPQNIWGNFKRNAAYRNLDFNISIQYGYELFIKQNKKCALSGLSIDFYGEGQSKASLDRIDSTKGYIKGNVQWLSATVNNMKWQLSQKEFLEICKKITDNNI